ncbi:MAG TPA: RhuM family protein [Prolixibacteraceae bacterium]
MSKKLQIRNSTAEFLVFTKQAGESTIEVRVEEETAWLTQKLIAVLFEVEVNTINYHIKEIYKIQEQKEEATIRNFRIVQTEGKRQVERNVEFYNLDMIISVGYRVNSERAIQFRQWATYVLRDFAIHGLTAAELILDRANAEKEHMGLNTWKNAPEGKIIKTDVSIAKNYLKEQELKSLDRFITMYLDYAEDQAERGIPMTMNDWVQKLNAFLQFNQRDILNNPGLISAEIAKAFAESEFEKYRIVQDQLFESDFDKHIKKQLGGLNYE